MPIKIEHYTCPICKKGNGFLFINNEYFKCDSCNSIVPNPLLKLDKEQHFTLRISLLHFNYEDNGKVYINEDLDLMKE